ncbi:MAG TPA: hypothetical protein VGN41_10980 [Streptosporangiaceae bacterium]
MDLAALFLWIVTAVAGLRLLGAGKPARASGDGQPESAEPVLAGAGVPAAASAAHAAGTIPPIAHTRVTIRPDEHPLLEFLHPALAAIGLGCMIAFVVTRFPGFAWGAFGVIVATIGAGLAWFARSRAADRRRGGEPLFPARLIRIHGSAASLTLVLAVLTALTAVRG